MKPAEMKLILNASDLSKSQSFYSAIGIEWIGGKEVEIGTSGLPVFEEKNGNPQGLPALWGHLGNVEVLFFLNTKMGTAQQKTDSVMLINFDDFTSIPIVVKKLKANGLFNPGSNFDETAGGILFDPDGRQINLCGPNPFRL